MSQKELHIFSCKGNVQPEYMSLFFWVRQRIISTPSKTARRFPSMQSFFLHLRISGRPAGVFRRGQRLPCACASCWMKPNARDDNAFVHLLAPDAGAERRALSSLFIEIRPFSVQYNQTRAILTSDEGLERRHAGRRRGEPLRQNPHPLTKLLESVAHHRSSYSHPRGSTLRSQDPEAAESPLCFFLPGGFFYKFRRGMTMDLKKRRCTTVMLALEGRMVPPCGLRAAGAVSHGCHPRAHGRAVRPAACST